MKIDKIKIRKRTAVNKELRIAIVISYFNRSVTDKLLLGAKKALKENGIQVKNIQVFRVPGSFEIPVITARLCNESNVHKKFDGIITLGCIIKGETAHFEYIASSVSCTLNLLTIKHSIPIGFGILTCYNKKQASDRCGTKPINEETNKGYEAALTVLEVISLLNKIDNSSQ